MYHAVKGICPNYVIGNLDQKRTNLASSAGKLGKKTQASAKFGSVLEMYYNTCVNGAIECEP